MDIKVPMNILITTEVHGILSHTSKDSSKHGALKLTPTMMPMMEKYLTLFLTV